MNKDTKTQTKRFCNGFLDVCNGIAEAPCISTFITISNSAENWYLIAPFGDHPKKIRVGEEFKTCIQRIDPAVAKKLCDKFSGVWNRVKTAFGNPCPVYYGHPDAENASLREAYPDKQPYGKVCALQTRADGLYAQIKWLAGFDELPKSLAISPAFSAEISESGGLEVLAVPVELRSLGIVERPNISKTSIVNSKESVKMTKEMLTLLGFSEEEAQKYLDGGEGAITEADIAAKIKELSDKANGSSTLQTELDAEKQHAADAKQAFQQERAARAKMVVENCIVEGKITLAEKADKIAVLTNAADFDALAKEMQSRPSAIKTASATDGLQKKQNSAAAKSEFMEKVKELQRGGKTYQQAWKAAETEFPELYKIMAQKS
ncbi:MAG: hypothetical protein IKS15_02645 [Opitutales bacterium]|nr:hypothetical protein [Opitutales bacterium]